MREHRPGSRQLSRSETLRRGARKYESCCIQKATNNRRGTRQHERRQKGKEAATIYARVARQHRRRRLRSQGIGCDTRQNEYRSNWTQDATMLPRVARCSKCRPDGEEGIGCHASQDERLPYW